ncbi:MAG: CoA ester lyase [Streptosporangiales bacterium]|nr:CoA ester lyase [Streptosporangiales bacterium]
MTSGLAGPALLFCPADRPDRYDKALAVADTVFVDLEDAVSPGEKAAARETVREALRDDPDRFVVRVNGSDTQWSADDVAMLRAVGASRVLLPKVGSAADVRALSDLAVVALCETVAGIVNARAIAAAENCVGLFFGAEDLTADLGGQASRDSSGRYYPAMEYAKAEVLFAAAASGKLAIHPVYLKIDDQAGLRAECEEACAVGFAAKGCIHPSQVSVVKAAFAPTPEQVEWAKGLMAAVEEHGSGVFQYQGQMVDGPLYTQAKNILMRTGE